MQDQEGPTGSEIEEGDHKDRPDLLRTLERSFLLIATMGSFYLAFLVVSNTESRSIFFPPFNSPVPKIVYATVLVIVTQPESISSPLIQTVEVTREIPKEVTRVVTVVSTSLPQTATAIPSIDLPFIDNFELKQRDEWQQALGTWRVVNSRLTTDPTSDRVRILVGSKEWTDYSINVDVWGDDWFYPVQILVRVQNDGYLAFESDIFNSDWILYVNGIATTIAHSDTGINEHVFGGRYEKVYHLTIEVAGDIYTAFVDGIFLLQVQDDTYESGSVGLAFQTKAGPTWFDNFQISRLP